MSFKLTVPITRSLADWIEQQADASGESPEEYCMEILSAYPALQKECDEWRTTTGSSAMKETSAASQKV